MPVVEEVHRRIPSHPECLKLTHNLQLIPAEAQCGSKYSTKQHPGNIIANVCGEWRRGSKDEEGMGKIKQIIREAPRDQDTSSACPYPQKQRGATAGAKPIRSREMGESPAPADNGGQQEEKKVKDKNEDTPNEEKELRAAFHALGAARQMQHEIAPPILGAMGQ
ncbi:hypothetical protein B0H19DRAFT_1073827 [Mycena capillaripes]|nr:hypothetical protein B0H19DRAFT_1073827 [Mycena capillaripes]